FGGVVNIVLDRETLRPSCTSCAALRRTAGVMKLRVPSSSSAPQRPQLERSSRHLSHCSSLIPRFVPGLIVIRTTVTRCGSICQGRRPGLRYVFANVPPSYGWIPITRLHRG